MQINSSKDRRGFRRGNSIRKTALLCGTSRCIRFELASEIDHVSSYGGLKKHDHLQSTGSPREENKPRLLIVRWLMVL